MLSSRLFDEVHESVRDLSMLLSLLLSVLFPWCCLNLPQSILLIVVLLIFNVDHGCLGCCPY